MRRTLTAIIERDGSGYVALCPELDVASQGATVEEARANLVEALELFFETADPSEVQRRMRADRLRPSEHATTAADAE
jgi:predicted RNase H-like HicB family nuclease